MMRTVANSYTNGTSALKISRPQTRPEEATIIAFPKVSGTKSQSKRVVQPKGNNTTSQLVSFIKHVFNSSEMYCSLRYESMQGCPYNKFSKAGIAALSAGASCIAIISLILGA